MNTKHTKGDWKLSSPSDNLEYAKLFEKGEGNLKCLSIDIPNHHGHIMTWGYDDDGHKANARLITQTPKMYKWCMKKLGELQKAIDEGAILSSSSMSEYEELQAIKKSYYGN